MIHWKIIPRSSSRADKEGATEVNPDVSYVVTPPPVIPKEDSEKT